MQKENLTYGDTMNSLEKLTNEDEIWSDTEYPNYEISSHGRLKRNEYVSTIAGGLNRKYKEKIFTGNIHENGYLYVSLKPHRSQAPVHELVAKAFLGDMPEKARTVNHIDGDKLNNRPSNLEWATYAENNSHARKMLLNKQHGEVCNLTKFSDNIVDAVRILYSSRRFTAKEIGGFFNMSPTHVYEISSLKSRAKRSIPKEN